MNKKAIIALATIIAVVSVGIYLYMQSNDDEPLYKGDNTTSQGSSDSESDDDENDLQSDLEKYRKEKTVSDAKTDSKTANEKHVLLNSDDKVLVETDSKRHDELKSAMARWNRALGENVFLPAKPNGRVDLLVQDDETQVPINLFLGADELENADKYTSVATNTNDHRIMILDDVAKHSSMSGFGDENDDIKVEKDLEQALGEAIGIDYDDNVVADKLKSEQGRKELRRKFNESDSEKSNVQLYNASMNSLDEDKLEAMNSKDNKTYATWTSYRDNIEHLPVFSDYKDNILTVINQPQEQLKGQESITQGKRIDDTLQETFNTMDEYSNEKEKGSYTDVEDEDKDGHQTIAMTPSTMGDDFQSYMDGRGEDY